MGGPVSEPERHFELLEIVMAASHYVLTTDGPVESK